MQSHDQRLTVVDSAAYDDVSAVGVTEDAGILEWDALRYEYGHSTAGVAIGAWRILWRRPEYMGATGAVLRPLALFVFVDAPRLREDADVGDQARLMEEVFSEASSYIPRMFWKSRRRTPWYVRA